MIARNTVGYVADTAFPQVTAQSVSNTRVIGPQLHDHGQRRRRRHHHADRRSGRGSRRQPDLHDHAERRLPHQPGAGQRHPEHAGRSAAGTYTFTNVQANQTISASFTQSQATITSAAGAGGSISPNGTQTVAIGGNQTYTITPNNGYTIADVVVDNVSVGAVGTYTFTNVQANHTISATFAANSPGAIVVTAPTGTPASYTQGDRVTVTWTVSSVTASGEFGVWAEASNGNWYGGDLKPASGGSANYTHSLTLNVPVGTGYRVAVMYRPTVGSGAWVFPVAYSSAFAVTAANVSVAVTAPTGTASYAQGDPVTVTWTASPDVTTGEYGVWAEATNGNWYGGDLVPASAPHSHNLTLSVPVGTGYRIAVMYRPTAGSGAWVFPVAYSPGTFDVTASVAVTVTAPTGTPASYAQGTPVSVTWTASPDVTTGEYGVWVEATNGNWYGGDLVPASVPHSHNLTLAVPVGTGYRIAVMYRPTAGSGAWVFPVAYSPGTFDVN